MQNSACPLCRELLTSSILYETRHIFLVSCPEYKIPGYCMIFPKRHVEKFWDLTTDEYQDLFRIAQKCMVFLEQKTAIDVVYLLSFGEVTRHFHFHIFPRHKWMKDLYMQHFLSKPSDPIDGGQMFSVIRETCRLSEKESACHHTLSVYKSLKESLEITQ